MPGKGAANSVRNQYPNATPFETKAIYVFGMVRHLIESAGWALEHTRPYSFPAYLLVCSAVELLGRCVADVNEDPIKFQRGLVRGLEIMIETCPHCGVTNIRGRHSKSSWKADLDHVVVSAGGHDYTIGECKNLRNFMAHGMASPKGELSLTPEFIGKFICAACRATDRYFEQLRVPDPSEDDLRLRLAKAEILPIWSQSRPIHVSNLYQPLAQPPFATPCGEMCHEGVWRRYCGL